MRRGTVLSLLFLALLTVAIASACSATEDSNLNDDTTGTNTGSGSGGGDGGGLTTGSGASGPGPAVAWLNGTVLAPEGTIPISDALIYVTHGTPEPIPQQVYCDTCIELASDVPYALSAADGSFSLGVPATGDWKLVVQKGAFRRIRNVNVAEGDQPVGADLTTLPGRSDTANGDDIPRMAVLDGNYDDIENSLAKLGLGQVDSNGTLMSGTEAFDIIDEPGFGLPPPPDPRIAFIQDYSQLSQYHIVFFPCASSWPDGALGTQAVRDNLLNFMNAGGKLYVTDYTYDVLRQINADPIKWRYDNGGFGDAESGIWDGAATADDPGLAAWLQAQNISTFTIEDNWTIIDSVQPYSAPDENGTATNMTPTVWVSADVPGEGHLPATVSYQYGCGRALFSTYHTEAGAGTGLLVQERALLYIILEVSVCIGDIPPPT